MKITEVKPEYVFAQLQKSLTVVAVNFERGEYVDLSGQMVTNVQRLVSNVNVKFFTVEKEN